MQNVSRIEIRTTISVLQKALEQMFLTYVPKPNYYGRDELNIYVNDQGYTDDCYNSSLGRRETLNIRVVGVNDPPVIRASNEVLLYGKGEKCFYDFQQFAINTPVGLSNGCAFIPNSTRVPPPIVGPSWAFDDVDMDDTPFGNMTLVLIVGQMVPAHTSAGTFIIKETLKFSRLWYEEYRNNDGLMQLVIQGSMAEINWLMDYLAYNADDNYQGYAPFKIIALDELNFGECSGDHACFWQVSLHGSLGSRGPWNAYDGHHKQNCRCHNWSPQDVCFQHRHLWHRRSRLQELQGFCTCRRCWVWMVSISLSGTWRQVHDCQRWGRAPI